MTNITTTTTKLYSWIPTNLGYLNFNYIADTDHLDFIFDKNSYKLQKINEVCKKITIKKTYLSDLNPNLEKVFLSKEIFPICEILINLDTTENEDLNVIKPKNFNGSIELKYEKDTKKVFVVKCNFNVKLNGKLEFNNILLSYNETLAIIDEEDNEAIFQTAITGLFTLLKKIIHGDHHHHQKVDTLIGVYKEFVPSQILTDLAFQIKRMEKFCKNKKAIKNPLNQNYLLNLSNQADGFMSYIDTFENLFKNELEAETKNIYVKKENIENVVDSIKASISKIKIDNEQNLKIKTMSLTLFAIFISLNIMFSNYIGNGDNNFIKDFAILIVDRKENVILLFSAIVTFLIFIFALENTLYSYISYKLSNNKLYNLYELFIFKVNSNNLQINNENKITQFHNFYKSRYLIYLILLEITVIITGIYFILF